MSKLNQENFRPLFSTWWPKIKPFFDSGEMDKIYEHIKSQSKKGIKTLPDSKNVFRCFEECPIEELKCVIVNDYPYSIMQNGMAVADGLALSCGITKYPQPELDQFFSNLELEFDNGLCLPCIKNPDLSYLAQQGILLLNCSLTVEHLKPNSHNLLWKPFMQYLFEEVLDVHGIPILLIGKNSHKLEKYINPFNTIFKLPSIEANKDWDSSGVFTEINKILKRKFNEKINWFDESQEAPF